MHALVNGPRFVSANEPLPPDDLARSSSPELDLLYRRERPRLLRYLAARTSPDAAQDIVQHLFARIVARADRDDAQIASPSAYLRQGARNLVTDQAKAAARRSQHFHVPIDDVAVAGPDPVSALEARDKLARLQEAVSRLKPLTREIFLARRVDGYSYAEIAEQTGLSVKGVEKQMAKAIRLLRRHLRRDD